MREQQKIWMGNILLVLTIGAIISLGIDYAESFDQTNITTRVNITNAAPEILSVVVNSGNNVVLAEGTTQQVICNITVRDYNGWGDINYLNATLYSTDFSTVSAPLDNNTNYFAETPTCTNSSISASTTIFSCPFDVQYFAYNGTWECSVNVTDSYGYNGTGSNTTTINPLYAINVTNLIDYGDMAIGDTSVTSETANITNFGNMDINISIFGYGGTDYNTGNGLAFICEFGNISIENQRYNITDQAWSNMIPLTNESVLIPDLTIFNQDTETPVFNSTYWRLYVPPNPFGLCNGTVVFEAELP